jgi:hypothetical protein
MFLEATDMVELYAFAKNTKPPDELLARVKEYIELMLIVSNNRSHGCIKELEARLEEINKRAQKNRPKGSKIPLAYLLTIQHLPIMRHYITKIYE